MREEEAIKEIENYLDYEGSVSITAIATLYTLYNKEKEKNKKLEIELEIKKYCKVDELTTDLIYYKNLAKEYQGNCISKDKIREKIKELDYEGTQQYWGEDVIKILKELLGDDTNE